MVSYMYCLVSTETWCWFFSHSSSLVPWIHSYRGWVTLIYLSHPKFDAMHLSLFLFFPIIMGWSHSLQRVSYINLLVSTNIWHRIFHILLHHSYSLVLMCFFTGGELLMFISSKIWCQSFSHFPLYPIGPDIILLQMVSYISLFVSANI